MTAKRFNRVGGYVYDGDKCISHFEDVAHRDDIVKLLNELSEENEQLRHDATILIQSNQDYRKENEQLKQRNKRLEEKIQRERRVSAKQHLKWSKEAETKIKELSKENEQLKQEVREYIKALNKTLEEKEELWEENEQLKQSINNLKDTIIKITIAYQRKYDRNIVDLVDEVHDEDITDLIKELK